VFRTALSALCGMNFHRWNQTRQEILLRHLSAGNATLAGVPSRVFFQMLLGMTVEGFFAHPVHGGTRDRVSWPMDGFPGAHAARHQTGDRAIIDVGQPGSLGEWS
jgi:gluconate 2-dehydrogenase gamma chain